MIDRDIQEKLFDEYGTPEHVRRHCTAVAEVTVRIGRALNDAGYDLDLDLTEGAARVHDIARTADNHADVGAEFIKARGFDREAELVRGHMVHSFGSISNVDEQDVLCLADRVVREDHYVGIAKRVEYLLSKPGRTEGSAERIKSHMAATQEYINRIEETIGISFDELLSDI